MPRGIAQGPSDFDLAMERLVRAQLRQKQQQAVSTIATSGPNLEGFVRAVMPEFHICAYHKLIFEHLEALERGDIKRLMLFVPPRHSKTLSASTLFPAWYLGRNPKAQIIVTSYNAEFAQKTISANTQSVMSNPAWPYPGIHIPRERRSLRAWDTNLGGKYVATGIGGPITGRGADLCVVSGTMVETEHGPMEVGHLVSLQDRPRVLAFDHGRNQTIWCAITNVRQNWDDDIIEVQTHGGRVLRVTADHPIWTLESGYREAALLSPGERLLAAAVPTQQDLRQLPAAQDGPGCDLPSVLLQDAGAQCRPDLRALPEAIPASPVRGGEAEAARPSGLLLFPDVLAGAPRLQAQCSLPGLRQAEAEPEQQVLLTGVQADDHQADAGTGLRALSAAVPPLEQSDPLLLTPVCGCSALAADDRGGQFASQRWQELREVVRAYEATDPGAGQLPVHRLPQGGVVRHSSGSWPGAAEVESRDPSPQRAAVGQSPGEPGGAVRNVPHHPSQVTYDTVAVVRRVRGAILPVYDLEVAGAHNFFADQILVHNCIMDDVIKNREEADSPIIKEAHWQWYISTLRTRLQPGGRILFCNTRWSDDDLAGRLLDRMERGGEQWTVLRLPAVAEDDDLLGRAPGEVLCEHRYPIEELNNIRYADPEEGGERNWSALYQQRPVPAEGNLFKLEWFSQTYEREPKGLHRFLTVDGAYKEGVGNDFSVIQVWGIRKGDAYVLHAWRGRVEFPELLNQIERISTMYKTNTVLIEDSASGQPAIQVLRRNPRYRVVKVTARGTKIARAEASTKFWEMGKVWVPKSAPWLPQFMDEHLRFPAGKHDDHVDASSQFLRWAMKGYAHIDRYRSLRVETTPSAPARWEEPVEQASEEYKGIRQIIEERGTLAVGKEAYHASARRTLEQVGADLGTEGDRDGALWAQGEMRRLDRMYGSGIR